MNRESERLKTGRSMFENRRKQLNQILRENGMQAVIISSPSNLYYFTGFTGGEAFFVMLEGEEKEYIITDSRYYEQVEKECPKLSLIRLEQKGYSETV